MKKLLAAFLMLVAFASLFAATRPFTLGPNVTFSGTANFELLLDPEGVKLSGSLADVKASLAFGPTSATEAGVTLGLSYTPFGGVSLTLRSISFKTPFFDALYSTSISFLNDYFTGRNANGNLIVTGAQGFQDMLRLTFPTVPDFEFYLLDKTAEATDIWFNDMLLAKYKVGDFNIFGGFYDSLLNKEAYEYGVAVDGKLDLGIFKPDFRVFAGMAATPTTPVDATPTMVTVYDVFATGSIANLLPGLTLTPNLKFSENLAALDYKSSTITDGKFVSLGVRYELKFDPVTLVAMVTPKYDFVAATPTTLPLNELSASVNLNPVTLLVRTTNADLLDATKKYTLYAEGKYTDPSFNLRVRAFWSDVAELANYTYIHIDGSAKFDALTLGGNYRMRTAGNPKEGYNVLATYQLAPNTTLSGFYGTLTRDGDGNFTVINADPTWNVALRYSVRF